MLTASGLSAAFGTRVLFSDVTLTLSPGRRIALVGANGSGKTTLLEMVVGRRPPDSGTVNHPADHRIGYLPQDLTEAPTRSVLEEVLAGAGEVADLHHRLMDLEQAMADGDQEAVHAYGEAQARYAQLNGYALESDAHRVLAGLGFAPDDADRPVAEMSGGWRMRVALARLLLAAPDLLVLDEPTNHLDVDSVAWLEQHLAGWTGALLFVSHDRDFIDAVANRIVELSGGTTTEFVGGFAEFVAEREERIARMEAAAAQQQKQIAQTERFIERFRYKATKARQVQSRVKALEKLDRIEVPQQEELKARFRFPDPPRSGRLVAELEGVDAGYDDEIVLRDVNVAVERGQKVALVGPNGAGKTTMLRLLTGELESTHGRVRLGSNVEIAAFAQHQAEMLDDSRTVVAEFKAAVGERLGKHLRTTLGSFGFGGDAADRLVGVLSGGERTRLALAKIMVAPANLLVLDEPTNHLDLPSCDILEDALSVWPGTVLLVTHDRHLIRNVATDLIEVRGGTARWHHGVDEAVLAPPVAASLGSRRAPTAEESARPAHERADRKRAEAEHRNRSHRETKDLKVAVRRAERRWEQAEAEVADTQRLLADNAVYDDPEEVAEITRRHDRAKEDAARAMAEWERAATRLEQVEQRLAAESP